MKHLIFDVNVIIDYWLHEKSAASTLKLLESDPQKNVKKWIVASQLHTLHYTCRSVFKRKGVPPEQVSQVAKKLLETLLRRVEVLSNFGFEQATVYQQARDFEDAQIAAAARSLGEQAVCIVTEDQNFDTLGEVLAMRPAQALAWLQAPADPPSADKPLPFIDLAAQQAQLRPQLEQGIERMLRHGQYILGPEVAELEEKLTN
jgi:UDP-2-acetamido-2-deoxy-ribo-hexuluronate aminotransferase